MIQMETAFMHRDLQKLLPFSSPGTGIPGKLSILREQNFQTCTLT